MSIHCEHRGAFELLHANFAAMTVPTVQADLRYQISMQRGAFQIRRGDEGIIGASTDLGGLLYLLDSDLVVQLQRMRKDLMFVHGAVLADTTGAHLLTGRSGAGKSTTCWGLLRHGFEYLSDELAPIRLPDLVVQPFPRALCMKTAPPPGYELAADTPEISRGFHVPVSRLPSATRPDHCPVRTLFFVEYAPGRSRPIVRPIGAAEAATRLYPNVLNALAHDDAAMHGVTRVASTARAFVVDAAELSATTEAIHAAIREQHHDPTTRPSTGAVPVR